MREKWSSNLGFVLASIGAAVGLGNIWRFPYIVGLNGGGAFLVPYLIAIVFCGLPLMVIEFALGRHFKTSVVPALQAIRKKFRFAGVFIVCVMGMVLSYYLVITSWVLAYSLFFILRVPISFSAFTASYYPLLFFLVSAGIAFLVVRAGVNRGIERLSKLLVPFLFAIVCMLVVFSLSLPGAMRGIEFYLTPDFSKLLNPFLWAAAFGQTFFSLSVGGGIMLTYGSYLKEEKIVKNAAVITAFDLLAAILSGFIIFPIVFSFGLDPASGVNLAFVALPPAFQQMSWGNVLGTAFFLLLFFAAITPSVSMLEVPVATLMDSYGFERKKATWVVSLIVILMGLPSALSYTALQLELYGKPLLDLKDFFFGTIGLITSALVLSIIAGWFLHPEIIIKEVGGNKRTQKLLIFLIKFLIPIVLAVTLAAKLIKAE